MTARVTAGLKVVQLVAERLDPTEPLAVGSIARDLGMTLSSASRLCSELESEALLERGGSYGAYRLGPAAIELSGRAAAPFAQSVRYALTLAAQQTGETVCIAAPSNSGLRIVAAVDSTWTLHSPADVGGLVNDERSAIIWAAEGRGSDQAGAGDLRHFESTVGMNVDIATPVLGPQGECVAVLAVRLPVNRSVLGVPRARRALAAARRSIERRIEEQFESRTPAASEPAEDASALAASLRILRHLAGGQDSLLATARATGLRADRTQRLVESCARAGLVKLSPDRGEVQLAWNVHGWHRAAAPPTIVERGKPMVAETARATGACAFITVLQGMRSVTLVEELEEAGEGLRMTPWLGRPCSIIDSDGGASLVMDLRIDELSLVLPSRHSPQQLESFLDRVRRVVLDGVLASESIMEAGFISISAPVRDSSGAVAAAACIVGTIDYAKPRVREFEEAARALAAQVSALLGYRETAAA